MLDELTPEQFAEWQAFARLRPFGTIKPAEQMATVLSAITAFGGEPCDVDEVLRAWGFDGGDEVIREQDVMTAEETFDFFRMAFGV